MSPLDELNALLASEEDERLECKEAKTQFSFDKLADYCVALACEGGGKFVLGVTDAPPREVVGSRAFRNLQKTKHDLLGRLHFRVDAHEVNHPDGRVVIFDVPPCPPGMPPNHKGGYWMRSGGSLVPMTPDRIRALIAQGSPDFSAEACRDARREDLDPEAIREFRNRWARKSGNQALLSMGDEQLLADAELVSSGDVTNAALVLLGRQEALNSLLPQAEVIFEYRASEASGPAQQRIDYRKGFFLFADALWETINSRNETQHFQEGLFVTDIPTFSEPSVREAVLNAVTHRDYRLPGSVIVRQFPRRLEVTSPGGFPEGVSVDNILSAHVPRNRRIAEAFQRCGLVERSGQGVNRIFEESIKQAKLPPDFLGTDPHQVFLTLKGEVQDPHFIRLFEKIGQEELRLFATEDFLILDLVRREQPIPESLRNRLPGLVDRGVVERIGKGRGVRYFLSRRYYAMAGRDGVYTRKRGLDRAQNRQLLLEHIRGHSSGGVRLRELEQVLPGLSKQAIQGLLRELKADSAIYCMGRTRSARWYPSPGAG